PRPQGFALMPLEEASARRRRERRQFSPSALLKNLGGMPPSPLLLSRVFYLVDMCRETMTKCPVVTSVVCAASDGPGHAVRVSALERAALDDKRRKVFLVTPAAISTIWNRTC